MALNILMKCLQPRTEQEREVDIIQRMIDSKKDEELINKYSRLTIDELEQLLKEKEEK